MDFAKASLRKKGILCEMELGGVKWRNDASVAKWHLPLFMTEFLSNSSKREKNDFFQPIPRPLHMFAS